MLFAVRVHVFFLLTSCGRGVSPENSNALRRDNSPVRCSLTQEEVTTLKAEPLLLIQKIIASEPAFESLPFAESLSAWQACYESL